MPDQKIFIVDDETISRQLLQAILLNAGYRIDWANSGQEALNKLPKSNPDLILLDIMMPGMDGFKTIEQIKKIPSLAHVPVIFVTALDDRDTKGKAVILGAYDYISKPYNRENVLLKINRAMQVNN